VCRRLKASPKPASNHFLFSPVFTSSARRAEALAAGADACLALPIQASELLAQIECLLRGRASSGPAARSEERFDWQGSAGWCGL